MRYRNVLWWQQQPQRDWVYLPSWREVKNEEFSSMFSEKVTVINLTDWLLSPLKDTAVDGCYCCRRFNQLHKMLLGVLWPTVEHKSVILFVYCTCFNSRTVLSSGCSCEPQPIACWNHLSSKSKNPGKSKKLPLCLGLPQAKGNTSKALEQVQSSGKWKKLHIFILLSRDNKVCRICFAVCDREAQISIR